MNTVKVKSFHTTANIQCANNAGRALGHHKAGSKWGQVDRAFHIVFPVGTEMPLDEFRVKYANLVNSIFNNGKSNYGKAMASVCELQNGLVHEGCLEIY